MSGSKWRGWTARRAAACALAASVAATCPSLGVAQVAVTSSDCIKNGVIDFGRGDPTCDPEWSLKHTGADRAKRRIREERRQEPGEGIVVAVLDSGYGTLDEPAEGTLLHPELGDALVISRGYAFECDEEYDHRLAADPPECPPGERPARDRMDRNFNPLGRQPGHGTGTMSVLASPDGAQTTATPNTNARVVGVAPGVRIVPLRAIRGVVLMEKRAWDVSRAIARVLLDDPEGREPENPPVDVISMSLGRRAPYGDLEKAVLAAERRGVIVVAAAGQGSLATNGGAVRFPAQYPSVVAVGGTRVDARPWSGWLYSSGKGRALDVAAPAVDVWQAAASGDEGSVAFSIERGRGTSFAAPQAAGAAALWLQWYGREALNARYGRAALSQAFVLHLRNHGVRKPHEMAVLAGESGLPNEDEIASKAREPWPADMGPGILAVDKLIESPVDLLPTRREVCEFVYRERGAEALASLCPPRECPTHVAADCAQDQADLDAILAGALLRPAYRFDPKASVVAALLFGQPFGWGADTGHWYSPVLSFGVIVSRHQFESPRGVILQARVGEHGIGAGIGYAWLDEYGPLRNAEGKYSTIPGFGGLFGYSAQAAYLFVDETHHVGLELGGTLYRLKVSAGVYRALGSRPQKEWRYTLGVGFGF